MEESLKKKNNSHIIVTLLLVLGLLSITLGITMAFFNYTRTGSANVLAVGRIYFNSSQGTSINLTNVFPVKSTELENNPNVDSVTLTITGDTTYNEGLEYLVSADQVVNTVSGKKVPIGTSVTVNNLGTSDDSYFTNRGGNSSIYKILSKDTIKEDGELVVGYITKGATGVNGTVTVSAWLDGDKLAISDTFDGTESDNNGTTNEWVNDRVVLTTTEWNSLQSSGVSFKLRVEANEGVWVEEPLTAYGVMQSNADRLTLINFADRSSASNGQGLYILPGTESDIYPIYYYRGEVDNNNVVFAGFCWQMVRTTETGGIKMIYNGLPNIEGSGNDITYNCGTTRGVQDTIRTTTSLQQSTGYYYADDYEIASTSGNSVTYRLKSKTNPITQVAIADASGAATAIPTIASSYPYTCKQTTETGICKNLYKVDSYESGTSANVYSTYKSAIGKSKFNLNGNSISDVGYMSNTRYNSYSVTSTGSVYFGGNVEYDDFDSNGTSEYRLVSETISTSLDATHHYTCNLTNETGTCTTIRYYYYANGSGSNYYYINLTNGELIEDALYKMTGNGDAETKARNSGYNINVNNSTAKTTVDNWFRANLTNEIDENIPNYSIYLEDAIYCNDRSYKTVAGNINESIYDESGWNKSGGDLTKALYFGTYNRFSNNWYSTVNVPSMTCPNETDRFTVSSANGNGALKYPVGLLTADEIVLAGAGGVSSSNVNYYFYIGDWVWSMSPCDFPTGAREFRDNAGNQWFSVSNDANIRPVISLKHGTEFESDGDGTGTNPYVVKYN